VGCVGTLVILLAAAATGGAPTHHLARTLLPTLLACLVIGAEMILLLRVSVAGWRSCALLGAGLCVMIVGYVRPMASYYGVDRRDEMSVGRWLAQHAGGADRVMIDPAQYRYFAIEAAMGAPERVLLSPIEDEPGLRDRARSESIAWIVSSGETAHRRARELGSVAWRQGAWEVVKVEVPVPPAVRLVR
jgi:hypothetical protein